MLSRCNSNRLEPLAERLAEVLREPLEPVLAPETVVVQGPGMARWLSGWLAERLGVCANVRFVLPASAIWEWFRAVLPRVPAGSPFAPEPLAWRIFGLFSEIVTEPGFEAVRRYLGEGDELRRFRLAGRIAEVFDRYQVYRPEWIRAWERGEGSDWQALLWRRLAAAGEAQHWVGTHDAFLAALAGRGPGETQGLPPRVSLFALPALSPTYLDLSAALAERVAVHLFVLDPSREYWGDIEAPGTIARLRERWRRAGRLDASGYYAVGNPLLASLGRMGRDFLARLAELPAWEEDRFVEADAGRLLGAVQRDLLELRGGEDPRPAGLADGSIQIHSCHSRLREVQVLHDRLLDLFERLEDLEPREVLVAAPDPEAYAPFVEAVFGAAEGERHIPWSFAARDPAVSEPVVATVLRLLDLPSSRLAASEAVGLLEVAPVARRFGLDEAGLERVRTWVREAGVRWGADGAAREALGLPGLETNTWAFGLRRLFLGYAMGEGDPGLFRGVLPYPHVEGSASADLGGLQSFVDRLREWQARLARPRPMARWVALLGDLVDAFLAPDPAESERLEDLREAAAALAEECAVAGLEAPVGGELFADRLRERARARAGAAPALRGGVNFGSLAALRAIPARVVCLLGMNAADFPRVERPPGFDRMAQGPARPGDRARREEDRQLFLDALLAAREVFYLSYAGRSVRDNRRVPPSVVVSELLDYLAQAFAWPQSAPVERLLTEHPLQPFSPRYFDGREPALFSFATQWVPVARAGGGVMAGPFAEGPLGPPEGLPVEVDLDALVRFFRNPSRQYLRERLGVRLEESEAPLEDAEAFDLAGLARYRVREAALARALAGEPVDAAYRGVVDAAGELPLGAAGDRAFRDATEPVVALAGEVGAALAEEHEPVQVDLAVGVHVLRGWLSPVTAQGLVACRPSPVGPRDRIALWVRHLALNAAAPPGVPRESRHYGEGEMLRLGPVADAPARLARLVELYRQGLCEPLPFYPATSLAYAAALARGKGHEEALRAARGAWEGSPGRPGEGAEPEVALAQRGRDPLGAAFAALARELLWPMIECAAAEGGDADAGA